MKAALVGWLLLAAVIVAGGCDFSREGYVDRWYVEDGLLCHEVGDPASQIGTAIDCEVQ